MTTQSPSIRRELALHEAALTALGEGHLDAARVLAADAVEAAVASYGAGSPVVADLLLTCEAVAEAAGDFGTAQQFAARAADVVAAWAGTEDTDLMALWVDVEVVGARLESALGDFDLAEARLHSAHVRAGRVLAPDNPSVLAIHHMRGITAKYAGRFDDAARHYERVRAALEDNPVADPGVMADLLHNLGGLDHSRGRAGEGLVHAQRGLHLRIDAVGSDHPDVARDLNAIGALHHDAGDVEAALEAYRRALDIFEATLGVDHYETGMTCANLAVSTAAAGDAAQARRLYERSLNVLGRTLGDDHPDVALVQHNLAVLIAEEGDLDAAVALLSQAQRTLAASVAADHPRRINLAATLAEVSVQNTKSREHS